MLIKIKGSVNGGICITLPSDFKIWVDFYPDMKTVLWEYVHDPEWEEIKKDPAVFPPDLVLATHTHPDHFSFPRTNELSELCPGARIVVPKGDVWSSVHKSPFSTDSLSCEKITGDIVEKDFGDVHVKFIRTVHSGREYIDVPHYSLYITYEKKHIFISGDACVTDDDLCSRLEEMRTDLAVLNFPWACVSRGREIIEYSICPSHVLLVHLPSEEKDDFHYRKSAENSAELLNVPDVRLFLRHSQEEEFNL